MEIANGGRSVRSFATPSGAGASFGYSVALSGTNALVGAPLAGGSGRVYQYVRMGDSWALKETFQENASPQHGLYGQAVAISSDLAIVSAHFWRGDGTGQGQIIRFSVNGNAIAQLGQQDFSWPFDQWGYESFGEKVVITPSHVFVSAPARRDFIPWTDSYTNGTFTNVGWLFAFARQGANGLTGPQGYSAFDPGRAGPPGSDLPLPYYRDVHYTSDIAASGSTLAVGSELFKVVGKPKLEEGRVYTYDIPASTP